MKRSYSLSGALLALVGCAPQGESPDEVGSSVVAINAETLEALDDDESLTVDLRDVGVLYEIDGAEALLDTSRIEVIGADGVRAELTAYLAEHFPRLDLADFFVVLPDRAAADETSSKTTWRARSVPTMSPDRGYPE
jgi:hypothetical protein